MKGATNQLKADGLLKDGCYGIQVADDDMEALKSMFGPEQGYSGKCRDDLTRQVLKDELVTKARAIELADFHSKSVWRKVSARLPGRPMVNPPSPSDGWTPTKGTS